jgi:hypothetical protein
LNEARSEQIRTEKGVGRDEGYICRRAPGLPPQWSDGTVSGRERQTSLVNDVLIALTARRRGRPR